jgi:hypothetical protein
MFKRANSALGFFSQFFGSGFRIAIITGDAPGPTLSDNLF